MFTAATVLSLALAVTAQSPVPPCSQYDPSHRLETPCNIELRNTTRYQLRVYGVPSGQSFSTAVVQADSWSGATRAGFQLNFAYIEGLNKDKKKIPMTAPVATRNPTGDERNWLVSFFTPQSLYPTGADAPVPSNADVSIESMPLSTFAVIEFAGEANEGDYKLATTLLKEALVADGIALAPSDDIWAEAWMGYDAPNDLFNRHNEAWVKVVLA